MTVSYRKFAFVSGKGGVGKTVLAANFAFLCSTRCRTVIVDLDFQNQGASGLLAQYLRAGCVNAFDLLAKGHVEVNSLIKLNEHLFFIPAFDPSRTDRFASQTVFSSMDAGAVCAFAQVLDDLIAIGDFNAVIVDCHGGLDDNSFSAFICSDMTFVVTEADKVTFSGTLELMDFYVERAGEISSGLSTRLGDGSFGESGEIVRRVTHVQDNKLRFLVNRTSDKFGYNALISILAKQFDANVHFFREMSQGFSFFPADPLLSESFSEYPFYVELLPESIFSQKLELLYYQVTGASAGVRGRSRFYRWFERISPKKLEKTLRSPHEKRMRAVFSFVALMQTLFSLLIVLLVAAIFFGRGFQYHPTQTVVMSVGLIMFGLFLLYMVRFNLLVGGYYRDRLRYEWRLYSRGNRKISTVFMLRILRAFSFRYTLLLWAWLYLLNGLLYTGLGVMAYALGWK